MANKMRKGNTGPVTDQFRSAMEAYRRGNLKEAERLYRMILSSSPDHPETLVNLGLLLGQSGNGKEGVDLLRKAVAASPENAQICSVLGNALLQEGRLDEAVRAFSRVTELAPERPEGFEGLGRAHTRKNELDQAEAWFLKALAITPDFAPAHLGLGVVHGMCGRWERARNACFRAVELNPQGPTAYNKLAAACLELGEFQAALAHFEQAVRMAPDNVESLLGAAIAHHRVGKFATAKKEDRKAHYNRALSTLDRARKLAPESATVHEKRGSVCLDMKRFDEAVSAYLKALEIDPGRYEANNNLSIALRKTGDKARRKQVARLGQDRVYAGGGEAVEVAVALAGTCPYPNRKALVAAREWLSGFDPETAWPHDWWEAEIGRLAGLGNGEDKVLRTVFSQIFSWSVPTREALEQVAGFCDKKRLFSYGAGTGYWEYLLATTFGVAVVASEISLGHRFLPMEKVDFASAAVDPGDVIFISWILNESAVVDGVMTLLGKMAPGQRLVIVGDEPDELGRPRVTGSTDLFRFLNEKFELAGQVPLARFPHIYDSVKLYTRT